MKIIVGIFMFTAFTIAALAQPEAKAPTLAVPIAPSISAEKIVKNSPFSAEAVSESVQTLADGNRIVRSSTSKLYRNSEGRFRREVANGSGGLAGTIYTYGSGITILDPVVGFRYQLDTNLMTAQQYSLRAIATPDQKNLTEAKLAETRARAAQAAGEVKETAARRNEVSERMVAELKAANQVAPVAVVSAQGGTSVYPTYATGTYTVAGGSGVGFATTSHSKYETRIEKLGTQNIEGVEAEGTRRITTIPAGAIGNERPIEIVYESWYSNELQLVVLSKTSDPRIGDQTYRLTNITRSEPDPASFSLPAGYRVVGHPTSVNKVAPTRAVAERPAVVKATVGPTAVSNKP